MIQKVLLPKLGQTVETAVIETWHKAEGDTVAKGDILCEITTDKATLEVESYAKGTLLRILGQAGQEMPVNSVIALVGDPDEEIPAADLSGDVVEGDAPDSPAPAAKTPPAATPDPATVAPKAAVAAADVPSSIQTVLLPKLGQTVEEAVIESWRVAEGDTVAKGDILCEITTDKATLEVESYAKGTLLRIIGQAGQTLPVNSIIALIGDPKVEIPEALLAGGVVEDGSSDGAAPAAPASAPQDAAPAPAAPAPRSAPAPVAAPPPPAAPGRIFVSPRARKLAKAEHVPVAVLQGTGPNGRIVEADVGAYVQKVKAAKVSPLARKLAAERNVDVLTLAAAGKKVTKDDVLAAQPAVAAAAARIAAPKAGRVPLTPMRRIIAKRMLQSKHEIPCYYLHMDVDFTDLMSARRKLNEKLGAQGGPKISINDYIIMACARALGEFPEANSRWDGDGIVQRGDINVSMAVALDQGLIVPVVKNCERRSLADIAIESRSLVEKARSKRLLPEEYEGGTMTVSNLGMFGIKHFIPVVNPGESCILGLGIIEERVVVQQGGIHIRQMMTMALACDHRLIDGAVGARFLERIRDLLEHPAGLEK